MVVNCAVAKVPIDIVASIKRHCADLNKSIVLGLIEVESGFKNVANHNEPDGISSLGIMQVRFSTAKMIGCVTTSSKELFNVGTNIKCGCAYLRHQLRRYGAYNAALAAYNAGSAFVCRKGRTGAGNKCSIGKYTNQGYVDAVLVASKKYQSLQSIASMENE